MSFVESTTRNIEEKTGAYTLTLDDDVITADTSGGAFTITLPATADANGKEYIIIKTDSSSNAVTVDGDGTETINSSASVSASGQYDILWIVCNDGSEASWTILHTIDFA